MKPVPLLEYRSPVAKSTIDWRSRYRLCVPICVAVYALVVVAYIIISFAYGDDWAEDPLYYRVLETVIMFPSTTLFFEPLNLVGCGAFIVAAIINAFFWGFLVAALWHLVHVVISKLKRVLLLDI